MKSFSSAINPITPDAVVAFDLDDTLYKEADFVVSGYRAIAAHLHTHHKVAVLDDLMRLRAQRADDVLGTVLDKHALGAAVTKDDLLGIYRFHQPVLGLQPGAKEALDALRARGISLSLISDGRSRTQRNKLHALGLADYFDPVVISEEIGTEKPAPQNFQAVMMARHPGKRYVYVADNPTKDFVMPRRLGWVTICLRDDGRNIHAQSLDGDPEFLPEFVVDSFAQLIN